MANRIDGLTIASPYTLTVDETGVSAQTRATILKQDDNVRFPVNFMHLRVHDALATVLPGTAASDDLALETGTFGTAPPMITGGDMKALGATTRRARVMIPLPECYVAAQTVTIIINAGMVTTVADNSCTVDVEAYECVKNGTLDGSPTDLCATAAQSINSLTFAEKTFTITATGLTAGSLLDVRISIACNDAATGTAVTPKIGGLDLVCDIKG